MSAPWFNPNLYAWIPGTAFGMVGGILGPLAGICAPRGKAKKMVLGLCLGTMAVSAGLLLVALFAIWEGQPYGVWYGLGLPGVLGLLVLGINYPVILNVYRAAELRKMDAKDISLSGGRTVLE